MFKYLIKFKFDLEDALQYDEEDQQVDILDFDDSVLDHTFDTNEKIKSFEDWYNEDIAKDESEKINLKHVIYDRESDDIGLLEITTEKEINNKETFANTIVEYLFDASSIKIEYHVSGDSYEDYWNYRSDSPDQRNIEVDYDDMGYIDSYYDVTIEQI